MARPIDRGRAIGDYEGSLREIIHALKYERRRSLAAGLATLMRSRGADVLRDADAAVPIPLHRRRQRERGFNQAGELARQLGLPVADCLRRRRHTQPQAALPAGRRHANVRGAFEMKKQRTTGVIGARVVLVDDVCTTGATLDACALVLKRAGAREVYALTAARVVSRRL